MPLTIDALREGLVIPMERASMSSLDYRNGIFQQLYHIKKWLRARWSRTDEMMYEKQFIFYFFKLQWVWGDISIFGHLGPKHQNKYNLSCCHDQKVVKGWKIFGPTVAHKM